jgi:hypothetical protein
MAGEMTPDTRPVRAKRQDKNEPENLGQTIRAVKSRPAKPGKPSKPGNKGRGR